MQECIFCKIVNGEIPSNILFENEKVIAFADINPVAPVHILIIPKQHISSLNEVAKTDEKTLGQMMLVAKQLAKEADLDDGYRLVLNTGDEGGQTVQHVHLHLIGGRSMQWPPG